MYQFTVAIRRVQCSTILRALVAAMLMATMQTAAALRYSATPIWATVIDGDTRKPLEGVIALIIWELQDSNGGAGGYWIFEEAVSNSLGNFAFPGWGPKEVPQEKGDPPWRLGPDQPSIFLFKSGYPMGTVFNPWESGMLGDRTWTGDRVRSSIWNGKTIELRKFVGTNYEYLSVLSRRAGHLPLQACNWARIPRFTAALVRERGERYGPLEFVSLPTIRDLEFDAKSHPGCLGVGIIKKYLK